MLLSPLATRLTGALCVVLALILLLPIPFGNMPTALAISMLALGMLQRDGAWIVAGIATALASIAVVSGAVLALAKTGVGLLLRLSG